MNRRSLFSALIAGPVIAAAKTEPSNRELVLTFDYHENEARGCSFHQISNSKCWVDGKEIKNVWAAEIYNDGTGSVWTYDVFGDGVIYNSRYCARPIPRDVYTYHGVLSKILKGRVELIAKEPKKPPRIGTIHASRIGSVNASELLYNSRDIDITTLDVEDNFHRFLMAPFGK